MIQIKVVKAMTELITLDTRKAEILKALNIFVSLLKVNTARAYQKDVEEFLAGVKDLTLKEAMRYFQQLQNEGYSASTIDRKKAALSKFFQFLFENGQTSSNPFTTETFRMMMKKVRQDADRSEANLSNKPEAHHLKWDEVERMLSLCGSSLEGLRNRSIILLGDGTTIDRLVPVQVRGQDGDGFLTNILEIAAGYTHTIALKEDGTVWSWGRNKYGSLGDGTTVRRKTPVKVLGPAGEGFLEGIVKVAAGNDYSLALMNDGSVWAWGVNDLGQLGNGTTALSSVPTKVKGPHGEGYLSNIVDIDCGNYHSIALKRDGTLYSWGYNYYGQLGDGTIENRNTPVEVRGPDEIGLMSDVINIDAGVRNSIALKNDGTVWTWGDNTNGQLGDGTESARYSPVQVKGANNETFIKDVIAISMGGNHTIALKNDGTLWSWGGNYLCQLGDSSSTNRLTPVQVRAPARLDSYLYLW